ncbi:KRI1 [Cyberlindnera jadinii]|uniref:KRI1 protein n=1 Tax=Cyberlindnera jadinii (strain ATCC 18201 / CBS 1600 / BCRC 20928 / JCM 3617 / NBRC 0987 / NRRL Y-1542) TaxID=983966 RepID=A0A0H5CBQ1_CYBJN|nr:KRI1 [Cyberlindnera jadinii]
MARKKSAAKRAREAEEQTKLQRQLENADEDVKKQVIEEFESSEDESSSEEEDEYGELLTEDVEEGLNKVLDALKSKNKELLLNPDVKFFNDPEEGSSTAAKTEKQKPIYLKDYHRMNLLSGDALKEDIEDEGKEFKTYDQEKAEERKELLDDIKSAFKDIEDGEDVDGTDNEDDDGFLKKKDPKTSDSTRQLPNPEQDGEKFLEEFMKQHAWIPHEGDKVVNLDRQGEDDDEFDDAAEKYEQAYNFRYEDPNSAEIISYARNQATMRRNNTGARQKKREREKEEKKKAQEEKEKAVQKKKTEKVNKLTDILETVKKEYGADLDEQTVKKISDRLFDNDFDDSQWDQVLGEIFNDDFYNDGDKKPEWDDDDEIMKDSKQEKDEAAEEVEEAEDEPPKKKSKKEEILEKSKSKKDKKKIKELAEQAIEQDKLKIIDEVEEEREGRSKERGTVFKYREVSPESFGLTTREIFMADDADLNEFIGLKKLAPYRPKEQRVKDRRKFAKKKNLKEWRKKVFRNEEGPEGEGDEILIPVQHSKSKPKSKGKKH